MIAPLLALMLQTAPATDAVPLGPIGRQALPARGCAAFLWTIAAEHQLVAMVSADPAQIRLAVDGKVADFARAEQMGTAGFGFAGVTTYRGGEVTATVDLSIATRGDLSAGAVVPEATLRVDRPGRDTIVLPVAGLIGCS